MVTYAGYKPAAAVLESKYYPLLNSKDIHILKSNLSAALLRSNEKVDNVVYHYTLYFVYACVKTWEHIS